MKDPLQSEQTPYEILGVERGATAAEIERAFRLGLVKRGNVARLTAARLALQRPAERVLLDLFHYDPQVLARLTPNPLGEAGVLEPAQRATTAAAWERQLRANFPDLGIAHSLAVLWYWWAVHQDERLAAAEGKAGEEVKEDSSGPPLEERWERVIGYWGMVVVSGEFWAAPDGTPADVGGELRTAVVEKLRNKLHELGQWHRQNGAGERAGRYQELELAWSTEIRTGKDVASAGLRTSRGKIACGRLLMQQMGLLETVRTQVEAALAKNPSSARLKSLQGALSPYSSIVVLIEHKKPQAALEAIEALRQEEREQEEVWRLRTQAFHELGKQQASLGKVEEALESWAQALRRAPGEPPTCPTCQHPAKEGLRDGSYWCAWCGAAFVPKEEAPVAGGSVEATGLQEQIRSEIVATCHTRAAALQRHQRKEAIALLEKALWLVQDEKLQLTLAELLTQQGIETFNESQKQAESGKGGTTREIVAAFEQGLADLERAAKLGSKRAAEQVEVGRRLIEQAKSGLFDIPEQAQALMRQANDAAGREDWDTAVRCLREAINIAGSKVPAALRRNLAVCLSNRGISTANRAVEMFSGGAKTQEMLLRKLAERQGMMNRFSDGCAMCGKPQFSSYDRSWYSFKAPGGGTVALCGACGAAIQSAASSPPTPTPEAISLLKASQRDLSEAVELDPSNDHARKNLRDLEEVLSRVAPPAHAETPARKEEPVPRPPAKKRNGFVTFMIFLLHAWTLTGAFGFVVAGSGSPLWHRGFLEAFAVVLTVAAGLSCFIVMLFRGEKRGLWKSCSTRWRAKDNWSRLCELLVFSSWLLFFVVAQRL